ncbi:hypothetical protein FisN_19Lh266 [Fistulifera solaris]|uniref:BspA family leucine-rich repeat surface protein n=1 Tax=Fistulifera solaris TaxID=1519565 RepID=A0A1Z5K7T1_FISSO|nr:hypothetical protein FisN_19Lh266 [Fistulifera solaris]|eukprot:GAX22202.1 hypothetical protein FisN_19Lh266 [Fistulifera solaris]
MKSSLAVVLFAPAVLAQTETAPPPVLTENGFDCFLSTPELRDAVDAYLDDPSQGTATVQKYGWPIGNWCVRNIADFSYLFDVNRNPKAATFNEDLTGWVTTSARDMSFMFAGAASFNGDVSKFQTGRVLKMPGMFEDAISFNRDVSQWDVFNVRDFERIFREAIAFTGDISSWDMRCVETNSTLF